MGLKKQIADFEEEKARTHDRDILDLIDETTAALVNSGIAEKSVGVGDQAPDFTLPDAMGNDVRLSDLTKARPVILTFYRGKSIGGSLVAVSPLTSDNSLSAAEKNELAFPVLSDAGNRVADAFGLVFDLDERLKPVYKNRLGNDVEAENGDPTYRLPLPATYVISRGGKVSYAYVNADYRHRAEPADVIAVLRAEVSY